MTDGLEERDIWFWQVSRYLDEGWTVYGIGAMWSDPLSWLDALETKIRPHATRSEANRRQIAEAGGSGGA